MEIISEIIVNNDCRYCIHQSKVNIALMEIIPEIIVNLTFDIHGCSIYNGSQHWRKWCPNNNYYISIKQIVFFKEQFNY